MSRIAVLPLARPNFDVAYAEAMAADAFAALDATGAEIVGPRALFPDAAAAEAALGEIRQGGDLDLVLIMQTTFTDAAMTVRIAEALDTPLAIWAFPEPRTGGRLRLNAFCGLNLAAHALGLAGRAFGYLYAAPDAPGTAAALMDLLAGGRRADPVAPAKVSAASTGAGAKIAARLRGRRIGRIGEHPAGFHTCAYEPQRIEDLAGVSVEPIALDRFFRTGRDAPAETVAEARSTARTDLAGLEDVDAGELERSLQLKSAFEQLRSEGGYSAFAVRCWPEAFTDHGGAVCGPVAMMGEKRVPCACEADVYGALTSLLLQEAAAEPAFLVDLVDLDTAGGTAAVWHCGQAPVSMHDPEVQPRATVHSNRGMPLLYDFPLKPGRITLARVSQARGEHKLVLAGAEVERAPAPFSGTSGTVRFDAPAGRALDTIIGSGLEHHMALVYADLRATLKDVAATLGLPVLEIA